MKITKIGHCCLLIEHAGTRLLTDPGTFSTAQNELTDIAAVLITHEHADHFHIDSVKEIIAHNPEVVVITNSAVGKLLDEAGIAYTLLQNKESKTVAGITLEAFEEPHAEMYPGLPRVPNTGFFINDVLFYPGDAFIQPGKPVDILAIPVAGSWMKMSEGIDYAIAIKPRISFPVHDGLLKSSGRMQEMIKGVLESAGIQFVGMIEGDVHEF